MRGERWLRLTSYLLLLTSCGVTPLTNKISVGEEPFVIGVGEGPDSMTDLFAAPAGQGNFVRLTFNRAEERRPKLSADGKRVTFLRRVRGDTAWTLVALDLLSNDEELLAPADSFTQEKLGPNGEGSVVPCGDQLCVAVGDAVTSLGKVSDVIRWGADSVGYFTDGGFEVRPLGGGRSRRPGWKLLPAGLRELTYHGGKAGRREDGRTGGREDGRTGGREDGRTGRREVGDRGISRLPVFPSSRQVTISTGVSGRR